MMKKVFFLGIFLAPILIGGVAYAANQQAGTLSVVCGNSIKEYGEQCDGSALDGQTCVSRGFTGGTLSCGASCTFNTTACTSGGGGGGSSSGGGGGGGAASPPVIAAGVVLTGRAYPLSRVVVLRDGILVATTIAGPDANFTVTLSGLSSGTYNLSVYGEDNNGERSSFFSFPAYLTNGAVTNISGIFISPTIKLDKNQVKRGEDIAIFGQSAANSNVEIAIHSNTLLSVNTKADTNGVYLYQLDTQTLELGDHSAYAKSLLGGSISLLSNKVAFVVGDETLETKPSVAVKKGDVNGDNKVNLVDFSVAAYWYKRSSPPKDIDLNDDGKIDLVDFSIMAYHWTG